VAIWEANRASPSSACVNRYPEWTGSDAAYSRAITMPTARGVAAFLQHVRAAMKLFSLTGRKRLSGVERSGLRELRGETWI
jgi:hypothetical protein